jgi:phosphoenolpyruvate-protein kinase (PTS system EI component)
MLDAEAQALGVPAPPLGIMIETPAAAATAGLLAQAAAFFSVGTNDLAQYALAMDRGHSALAAEADALHPGVLRLIAMACDGARGAGRTISLCGGLASDPLAAPLLVGLGVGTLSAAPAQIGRFSLSQCEELARRVLGTTSAREARTALNLAVDPRILGAAAP